MEDEKKKKTIIGDVYQEWKIIEKKKLLMTPVTAIIKKLNNALNKYLRKSQLN